MLPFPFFLPSFFFFFLRRRYFHDFSSGKIKAFLLFASSLKAVVLTNHMVNKLQIQAWILFLLP